MKYIVITSKHHDGFCLWDSKLTEYDVMGSPFSRDILKELAEACRKEGIKLGFYHSILDWRHPHYGERRPWDLRPEAPAPDMDKYTQYMKGQLKELLTNYGDVAVVWFDGEWESPWTHERGKDLYDYVLGLAPKTIVNNRVDKGRSGMAGMTVGDQFRGDFGTPEQEIPHQGLPGVDWESCMTMNDTWGYNRRDNNWKSATQLIHNLIETSSKGGNFLLNVGPTDEGLIPGASVERLAEMGKWLKVNGSAIYGTNPGPFRRSAHRWTAKPGRLYCHVLKWPADGKVVMPGLTFSRAEFRLLGAPRARMSVSSDRVDTVVSVSGVAPNPHANVIEIRYEGSLNTVEKMPTLAAGGSLELTASLAEVVGTTLRQEENWLGFWTRREDAAVWEIEVARAGEYQVSVDFAVEAGGGNSTFQVLVNGEPALKGLKVPSTGSWRTFQTKELGRIRLPAGRVKLEVRPEVMSGPLMNLRTLRLGAS
jgi:alpha-L-fucosidase